MSDTKPILMHEYGLAELNELPDTSEVQMSSRASMQERDHDWDDGFDLAAAREALIYGWRDRPDTDSSELTALRDKLEEKVNNFNAKAVQMQHDVAGAYVDIDRYLIGEPECMIDFLQDERTMKGRALKVFVNATMNCNHSATEMLERGLKIMTIIEAAMATGANIELWVGIVILPSFGSGASSAGMVHSVQLKGYHDYLDPDVMAFCIAHPAFLRRIGFFLMEQEPDEEIRREYSIPGGYGRASGLPDGMSEQYDVIVDSIDSRDGRLDPEQLFGSLIVNDQRIDDTEGW